MKILGIIAEYNPFHHGHNYQLQEAKALTQADVVIVLMSGNVVQRGEFGILDKWQRAAIACQSGADLVVEAPLLASLQGADYFASWSMQCLSLIGCTYCLFGTESASAQDLEDFLTWEHEHRDRLQTQIRQRLKTGDSYVAAMSQAVEELHPDLSFDYSASNHTLGIQYTKANRFLEQPLKLIALPRISGLSGRVLLSGSQIRQKYQEDSLFPDDLPPLTFQRLKNSKGVSWEDYWPFLKYQLLCHEPKSLRTIFGMREGVEHLLLNQVAQAGSFEEYVAQRTSRRWTRVSLQRLLMATLLNITDAQWQTYRENWQNDPVARVLACNKQGQTFLKQQRNRKIHLFANLTQPLSKSYGLNLRADRIYKMNARGIVQDQIMGRYPFRIKADQSAKNG